MKKASVAIITFFFLILLKTYSQKYEDSSTIKTSIIDGLKLNDSLKKVMKEQDSLLTDFKNIKDDILAEKVFSSRPCWCSVCGIKHSIHQQAMYS